MDFILLSNPFFGRLLFVSTNYGGYNVDLSSLIVYVVVAVSAALIVIYLITRQLSLQHISFRSSASEVKNFLGELNKNLREKNLLSFAGSKGEKKDVAANALLNDFDALSEDVRDELIRKFSDGYLTLKDVINEKEVHADDKVLMGANISLVVLMKKFNHIPIGLRDEILKKFLFKGTKTDKVLLSKIFLENFKFIPDGLDNEIFLKLGDEDSSEITYNLSEIILKYFIDVPKDIRNTLILNFTKSNHDPTLENSVKIILDNFLRMPTGVRESAIKNYLRNASSSSASKTSSNKASSNKASASKIYINHVRELLNRYENHLPREMAEIMIKKIRFPESNR